jgi:O-antigen ligase
MTQATPNVTTRFDRLAKVLLIGAFLTFPVAMALGNVLAILCLVAILLAVNLRSQWRKVIQLPSSRAMLLLFLLILVGTSYTSAPGSTALVHLSKYAKLLVGLFFVSVLFDARTRLYCLYAFMAAMVFILVSAYCGIFVPLPWSVSQQTGWGVDHTVVGDYITQSVMMTFFVLSCLALMWKFKTPWARIVLGILAGLGMVSITHMSWGRTGVVLLFSCLLVFGLTAVVGKKRIWVAVAVIALLGLVAASSPLVMEKLRLGWHEVQTHESNKFNSMGHRLFNYKSALTIIQKSPLLGTGTGSFETEACHLNASPAECKLFGWHPHNQYLFFLVENGVLGGLLFVALIASLFYAAKHRTTPDKCLLLGFATMLAADSMVNSPLFSSRESHFFVLMMALLVAGPVIEQPNQQPPQHTP